MADAAREELLRLAWRGVRRTTEHLTNLPAARRAVEAGASPEDVATAMSAAAYEAIFEFLFVLDEGGDPHGEVAPQGWAVTAPTDGHILAGLHEELLMADPSGVEGADLFS